MRNVDCGVRNQQNAECGIRNAEFLQMRNADCRMRSGKNKKEQFRIPRSEFSIQKNSAIRNLHSKIEAI